MLNKEEKEIFGKIAWIIFKKGHLTINAIIRFTNNVSKKDVKKFIRIGLLKKHRTDTFELTHEGRILGFRYNERFGKMK